MPAGTEFSLQASGIQSQNQAKRKHRCTTCGHSFIRATHLHRHEATHMSYWETEAIICEYCKKGFSRKDVLLRHQRNGQCSKRKVTTSGLPIQIIERNNDESILQQDVSRHELDRSVFDPQHQTMEASRADLAAGVPTCVGFQDYNSSAPQSQRELGLNANQVTEDINTSPGLDDTLARSNFETDLQYALPGHSQGAAASQRSPDGSMSNFNILPDMDYTGSELTPLAGWNANTRFNFSYLDWLDLDFQMQDYQDQNNEVQSSLTENTELLAHYLTEDGRNAQQNPLRTDISTSNTETAANISNNASSWTTRQNTSNSQVNQNNTHTTPARHVFRPRLRQAFDESDFIREMCSSGSLREILKGLGDILSFEILPPLSRLNRDQMIAFEQLQQCLDLYIANFQPITPVIHLPSWSSSKCPTVLLSAMACIGAGFSALPEASNLSKCLGEMCSIALAWVAGPERLSLQDPIHITAACLYQIHALGSGDRRVYEMADAGKGALVTSLRRKGLFKRPMQMNSDEIHDDYTATDRSEQDVVSQWEQWRDTERKVRLAWAIFEYDCTLSSLTNRKGTVDVHELPDHLPCAESLWEAHSAHIWKTLASVKSTQAVGLHLPSLLQKTLSQRASLDDVPAWSKRICAQVFSQLLWDIKRIEIASMPGFLGLPQMIAIHQPMNSILLKCLIRLRNSALNPISTSDLVHTHITYLLCHHAHLFLSNSGLDLIVHLVSSFFQEAMEVQKSRPQVLQQRLRELLQREPARTRKLIWHAAQIVGLARETSVHALCKTTYVFTGYLYILTAVRYGTLQDESKTGRTTRLDLLPWHQEHEEGNEVDDWIKNGGIAAVGQVDNICDANCFPILKSNAINTLREMHAWKLSEKFAKVIHAFPW